MTLESVAVLVLTIAVAALLIYLVVVLYRTRNY
jgi:uncharacterized protein YoxC